MGAHHRVEDGELEPAAIELLIAGIGVGRVVNISIRMPGPDVGVPVRNAAHGEVQSCGNLLLEGIPGGADIATPGAGAITLQAGEGRAGEDIDTLVGSDLALVLIDAFADEKRVSIADVAEGRARAGRLVEVAGLGFVELRLRTVKPPGGHTVAEHVLLHIGPEMVPGLLVPNVIHVGCARGGLHRIEGAHLIQVLVDLGGFSDTRPDGDHHLGIKVLEVGEHLLVAGKGRVVETKGVPGIVLLAPVFPILDDGVERNSQVTVFLHDLHDFLGGFVALLALPEAEGPERGELRGAGQLAHQRYRAVAVPAVQEIVVYGLTRLGTECRAHGGVVEGRDRIIVPVHAVSLHGSEIRDGYLHVVLFEDQALAALVHLSVLVLAKAVDDFVLVEDE